MSVICIVESLLPVSGEEEYDFMNITGIGVSVLKRGSIHVPGKVWTDSLSID